ncbi:hypothetical protein OIU78_002188 [Salix suchowensis]|nr:hypothetical protein OIU78_002188 [Salix suchowensis]
MNPSNNATDHHHSSKSLHRDAVAIAIADLDGDGRVKVGTGSSKCMVDDVVPDAGDLNSAAAVEDME